MSNGSFIDPPSYFDALEEWEAFAASMRRIADKDEGAKRELEEAEQRIADLKAQGAA
ncbi:hypothetical protein [Phyllobacterium leguminum]|uniref:Uncharacterized protein n=1 Tax=Phyllobacterium leguminum TaxID=314237 RepID=A0A318T5P0_9HYPH|nr:hypothetical protein [Phyllobacterium leguminum]PYE89594.1 hypothetical protein C7477_103102 [Phyllobacterium leguminum]